MYFYNQTGLESSLTGTNSPRPPRPPRISPRNSPMSSSKSSPRASHRFDSDDSVIDLTVGLLKDPDSRRGSKGSALARLSRQDAVFDASETEAALFANDLMTKLQVLRDQYQQQSDLELSASDDDISRASEEPEGSGINISPGTSAAQSRLHSRVSTAVPTPIKRIRRRWREPPVVKERRPSDYFSPEWSKGGCTACGFKHHRRWSALIEKEISDGSVQSSPRTASPRSPKIAVKISPAMPEVSPSRVGTRLQRGFILEMNHVN